MKKKKVKSYKRWHAEMENAILSRDEYYDLMNEKDQEAKEKRNEIRDLERERNAIGVSTAIDAAQTVVKRSVSSAVQAGQGVSSLNKINKEIDKRTSELSYIIQDQNRYFKKAEDYERQVENLKRRLENLGCL